MTGGVVSSERGEAQSFAGAWLARLPIAVNRRWLDYAIRSVLFVAFVAYVYSARFAPYREAPFEEAEAVVRAVNAGYPFQLLDPGVNGAPPTVKRITELYGSKTQMAMGPANAPIRMVRGPNGVLIISNTD